jgi:hypothetical protein
MIMPAELDLTIGKGYDILNDKYTPNNVFKFDSGALREAEYGLMLPPGIEMFRVGESRTYVEHFETKDDYMVNRLQSVNVNLDIDVKVSRDNFMCTVLVFVMGFFCRRTCSN